MSKNLVCSALLLAAVAAFGSIGASCSQATSGGAPDSGGQTNGGGGSSGASSGGDGGSGGAEGGSVAGPNWTYFLIDDMETTTHGPIELEAGITPPLTPGYWYNSGAGVGLDAGDAGDMSDPPQGAFVFTALPTPHTTLDGDVSKHAARQVCVLTGLYDTCGVGFEFVQEPELDAGVADAAAATDAAAASDGGDAGPSIPRITIPFDITQYKGITFWGMTTSPDPTTGSLQVKVQFPDTDTDPRGNVCNGGSLDYSQCYNSYAAYLPFTSTWQQFIVLLDPGDGGGPPDGGIAIDPTWGYQNAQWIPTKVYGINWQSQKNTVPDAGPYTTDIWVDDVYFIK